MTSSPLVDAAWLAQALVSDTPPLVLDASFDLADPGAGQRAFETAHIPGAHYLHLDTHLCGTKTGRNGRHPLPSRAAFAQSLGNLGLVPRRHVVVMDRSNSMFAARAWWMLLWAGHARVSVLDGGWAAWAAAGGAVATGPDPMDTTTRAAPYPLPEPSVQLCDTAQVMACLGSDLLIDARAPERYRGDVEPLDPVAGHIPGAVNQPFAANVLPSGQFLAAAALKERWQAVLGADPARAIHQCGSGVTACHNLLATAVAGLPLGRLYAGSWSEWCADPQRPVETG